MVLESECHFLVSWLHLLVVETMDSYFLSTRLQVIPAINELLQPHLWMRVPLWVCTYEFWITRLPVPVSHLQVPASSLCTFSPQTRACSHPCQSRSQLKQVSALSAEIHISKSIILNSREHAKEENTHWYCLKHWHASELSAASALHSFIEASDLLINFSAYRTGNIESSRSEILWGDQVKKRTWLVWSPWVPVPVSEYCTIQDELWLVNMSFKRWRVQALSLSLSLSLVIKCQSCQRRQAFQTNFIDKGSKQNRNIIACVFDKSTLRATWGTNDSYSISWTGADKNHTLLIHIASLHSMSGCRYLLQRIQRHSTADESIIQKVYMFVAKQPLWLQWQVWRGNAIV